MIDDNLVRLRDCVFQSLDGAIGSGEISLSDAICFRSKENVAEFDSIVDKILLKDYAK